MHFLHHLARLYWVGIFAASQIESETLMESHQANALSDTTSEDLAKPDQEMRKIGAAGFTGTLIEFYDLQIYTTAAALVFAHVFFPQLGKAAGTVAAFGTVGVVFVARPFGSILFGHFGDRLGRKRTLVVTLLMMGLATFLTGLLPTSDQIGILAPILLVTLRVIQGIAAGGEFAGAALLIAESAPNHARGKWTVLPNLGGAASNSIAALTFLVTSMTMEAHSFRAWGWRIPFLFSSVLMIVGLYIRLNIRESSVFKSENRRGSISRTPFFDALRTQTRDMLLACLIPVPAFSILYLVLTYAVSYGVTQLQFQYSQVLWLSVANGVILGIGTLVTSRMSDRFGRRPVLIFSGTLAMIWAFLLFPVLHIGTLSSYATAVFVSMLLVGFITGPVAAFLSELFNTRYRYTAVGFCYNISGIIGGGIPPLIAGSIISTYGTSAFGKLLAATCLVSICCCLVVRETRSRALNADWQHPQ
jgi:MFS family permease